MHSQMTVNEYTNKLRVSHYDRLVTHVKVAFLNLTGLLYYTVIQFFTEQTNRSA